MSWSAPQIEDVSHIAYYREKYLTPRTSKRRLKAAYPTLEQLRGWDHPISLPARRAAREQACPIQPSQEPIFPWAKANGPTLADLSIQRWQPTPADRVGGLAA